MAMCLGWKSSDKCGRKDQIVAPNSNQCPDITWFWLGAVGVVIASMMTGHKSERRTA